jgi:transcriptional regulator NrdR family protein
MVCLYCARPTQVKNSRLQKRTNTIWRRRSCFTCGAVFTTIETPDLSATHVVRYKDGTHRPFSRDALYLSVAAALGHRPDAAELAGVLCGSIITRLVAEAAGAVLDVSSVVAVTTQTLQHFDAAAAVQYAAYHPIAL